MIRGGTVYIITNKFRTVLFVGVTGDLVARMLLHQQRQNANGFTSWYKLNILVYYRSFGTTEAARAEEKRIKAGSRREKMNLIRSVNPAWTDLWETEVSKW
ncbi:MAG TPA: GIY-YIG nuclease family protein [Flavisolibacter sp.]|jgi:putative endonuclease|nr:GIY-YIG nuclease family protein [Flavisolibacter sp.]